MGLANYSQAYAEITCCRCSVVFGLPDVLYRQRLNDHKLFWCPNGHDQYFAGKTPEQVRIAELERQIAAERQQADIARQARVSAEKLAKGANMAAKRAKTEKRRIITRIHAGVCPHCNRTFKQLAAHMKAKHRKAPADV